MSSSLSGEFVGRGVAGAVGVMRVGDGLAVSEGEVGETVATISVGGSEAGSIF